MSNTIRKTIENFDFGYVFTPKDFPIEPRKVASVNMVLNYMVEKGENLQNLKRSFLQTTFLC